LISQYKNRAPALPDGSRSIRLHCRACWYRFVVGLLGLNGGFGFLEENLH
jgi:hypothetical protein